MQRLDAEKPCSDAGIVAAGSVLRAPVPARGTPHVRSSHFHEWQESSIGGWVVAPHTHLENSSHRCAKAARKNR